MSSTTLQPLDETIISLVDEAARLLSGRRISILSGAGVSTDSGIPDYRGAGARVRKPMTFQTFLADQRARQRYWAGSHLGWHQFSTAAPNVGHLALADLEFAGVVNGVITQNVDGLHLQAGSRRVVNLHGTAAQVRCLACGQKFARQDIAERIASENPWLGAPDAVRLNPDGDVEVDSVEEMTVPLCTVCGGMLKPDVVFFGEFVPAVKYEEASAIIRRAEALIVAGSSLSVNSGIWLVGQANKRRIPVLIINRGETKGDSRASLRIDAGTSEVLGALRERLI